MPNSRLWIQKKQRHRAATTLLLASALISTAHGQSEPARHALLIGINEYTSPAILDLRGAVNDVTMVRRILLTRFGVAEQDIVMLTDEQATREHILAALDELAGRVGEDDFVYIHYSGHGSQVRDANGDEEDGWDETILPHDAREEGVPDIIDDEFESAFARLRTRNAFIVFDSCHSGTVTRSPTPVRPRFAPPDERADLYRRFAARTREVVLVEELPHVLMTGAPAGEEALDGPVDGGWYGLFSYALARSLDGLGPSATPADLHASSVLELRRIQEQLFTRAPEPQLEAPEGRLLTPLVRVASPGAQTAHTESSAAPGAHTEAPVRRAWLEIERVDADHVRLLDGAQLNANPGSFWGIYAAAETQFDFGNAIALGLVEELQGGDALLALQVVRGDLPRGGRAIALAAPDLSGRIPVRLEAREDRRARLQRALAAELPQLEFVGAGQFARFVVVDDRDAWHIRDAAGLQTALSFRDTDDATLARQLARVFATSATATALLGLDNPAARIRLWAEVVTDGAELSASGQTPPPAPVYTVRNDDDARSAHNSLVLQIRADRDVYLTIVDVDTEGGVNLLFPNDYQLIGFLPDGFVRANTVVRIPDSIGASNRAGFHWDYAPPAGTDTVRVFATTELKLAETIRRLAREARQRHEAIGELRSALVAQAVRGIRVVADEGAPATESGRLEQDDAAGDWTAASVIIEVQQ